MSNIGTLNEKPLHAALKAWVARPGDQFEQPLAGYVIDVMRDQQLIEIQTGNFSGIKTKLRTLVNDHPLHLIYPIPYEKWIIKQPATADAAPTRRKSPRKGRVEELFWQLVSIPTLLTHPHFTLEVVMTREEVVQAYHPDGNWRRRGWRIVERRLLEVVEQRPFHSPQDFQTLLPPSLERFSTADLARTLAIKRQLAQKMVYCLAKTDIIQPAGKRGRFPLYELVN